MKVIVDGIATEYDDQGHGPVLVMLHGWQDSLHTFDLLVPSLITRFRVVRLDLPGFGKTDRPGQTWDIDNYIEFVAQFLKKIECSPEYMVGHSFGARIIIKGVSEYTFVPKKIVLIGAAGVTKRNTVRNTLYKVVARLGKWVTAVPGLSKLQPSLRKKLYQTAGSDYLSSGPLRDTYLRVINEDLSARVRGISIPSLLVWGSNDDSTPLADGQFLEKHMQQAELKVFSGRSHYIHQEDSVEVVQAINTFLQ